jgi:protocatechuate 3,4-dioxygenase beta subunit
MAKHRHTALEALGHPRVVTYEGRPLPRPHEELVDQGLGFDVVTALSRRQALRALGLGAAAAALAACDDGSSRRTTASPSRTSTASSGPASGVTGEIPDETAGPFPGDGSNGPDVLEQSGILRSDIRSSFGEASGSAEGVPIELELVISDLAKDGAPFAGAAVYVWHCSREGRYSLYSDGVTDQNYLRGVQVADAHGAVRFTSIFPGCYPGRWPHIHFEVYPSQGSIADSAEAIAVSQVALPSGACHRAYATPGYQTSVAALSEITLESDNVFGDDGGARQLATVTGDATTGYTVSLTVGVDPRTQVRG